MARGTKNKDVDLVEVVNDIVNQVTSERPPVVFLHGQEPWLLNRTARKVTEILIGDDNPEECLDVYEGRDIDLKSVIDELRMASLFSNKQVVWLNDPAFLDPSRGKDDKDTLLSATQQGFVDEKYLVVSWQGKLDGRGEFARSLKKHTYFAAIPGLDERAAGDPSRDQAFRFLRSHIKTSGKNLTTAAFSALRERVENNLYALVNATETLIAYVDERSEITPDDVAACIPRSRSDMVYTLTQDIADGKLDDAMAKLRGFFERGDSPIAIHSVLVNHIRGLACAKALKKQPSMQAMDLRSYRNFSRQWREHVANVKAECPPGLLDGFNIGRHPFPIFLSLQQADAFPMPKLLRTLQRLHEIDVKLKSTSIDGQLLIESVVIAFCHEEVAL